MEALIDFLLAMTGSRKIEIIAVLLGLANITLLIRRSIWNYPFGIVMVTLYAWIFFEAKLYSDALLQPFFFVVQIYGWYYWLKGRGDDGLVVVRRLSVNQAIGYGVAALIGIFAWGTLMARCTDASFPYWDASILGLSIVAQFLLARRRLENWLVWIAVDLLAIGLYWTKDLYPTAALYFLFLILATVGYFNWRRIYKKSLETPA